MDSESRFIYSLLATNRQEQANFYSKNLPKGLFKTREIEIAWIYNHREKFGEYPSLFAFEAKFGKLQKHRDSLDASLQPVLDLAMFNQMRGLHSRIKKMLDEGEPIGKVMGVYKAGAEKLRTYDTAYVDISLANSGVSKLRYYERKRQRKGSQLLDSPWPSLNKMVKFFSLGELVTIAARLGMGKSWLALDWANHLASHGERVLFFSEEMPAEQVSDRLTALRFGLPYEEFREAALSAKDLQKWRKAQLRAKKKSYALTISADSSPEEGTLAHIATKIVQYRPSVVFIDGAYLITPEGVSKHAQRTEKIMALTQRLKKLAKHYKVLLVAVIQMNRTAEGKDGLTKGSIASVYGSDTWAQDSDWLLDISGKRGSNRRRVALLKGRESSLGEFLTTFKLDPRPEFKELAGSKANLGGEEQSAGKVSFEGVS